MSSQGGIELKDLLGNKGANLCEMTKQGCVPCCERAGAGVPPPPGCPLHLFQNDRPSHTHPHPTPRRLPVPPGFVVTTDTCKAFFEAGKTLPPGLKEEYMAALAKVEKQTGRKFGDTNGNPLLLSVRSGAVVSMPGMMDTGMCVRMLGFVV